MTIAEPDAPLWTAVKARGVQWPADVEEVAADLGAAWHGAADGIASGSGLVRTSGGDLQASWGDPAGGTAQGRAVQISAQLDQVQQRLRQQGDQATAYAESLIRSKNGIHQVINEYSPFYDLLDPRDPNPGVQWLMDLVRSVVDKATEAIRRLLTIESQGPQVDHATEGPNDSGRVGSVSGDASLDHGRWKAFDGALQGDYSVGLHADGQLNAPGSGDPIVDANVQAGARASLDTIDVVDTGPVKFSITPEAYLGPGANLTIDPRWEAGRFDLGFKIGASPIVGGSLGTDFSIDFEELRQSIFG